MFLSIISSHMMKYRVNPSQFYLVASLRLNLFFLCPGRMHMAWRINWKINHNDRLFLKCNNHNENNYCGQNPGHRDASARILKKPSEFSSWAGLSRLTSLSYLLPKHFNNWYWYSLTSFVVWFIWNNKFHSTVHFGHVLLI